MAAIPTLQIVTAENAAEGLQQAAAFMPDLVLLDYSLPDFNGAEVCRRLLAVEKTAALPVIMMSGHVPEMHAAALYFQNIIATLAKPFVSAALIDLVQETFRHPRPLSPPTVAPPEKTPPSPPPVVVEKQARPAEHRGNGKRPPVFAAAAPAEPPPAPAEIPLPAPSPPAAPTALPVTTPARLTSAANNNVIVSMPFEVVSLQLSPTLRVAAIRARPASRTVSLHIAASSPSFTLPETAFELQRVDLDERGQIRTLRLGPTTDQPTTLETGAAVPIEGVNVLASNGGPALQLVPTAFAPMQMHLLATFELMAVELSESFSVASIVLQWGGGQMRVTLQPETAESGAIFQAAQVLLDDAARIAEILFDAVA